MKTVYWVFICAWMFVALAWMFTALAWMRRVNKR